MIEPDIDLYGGHARDSAIADFLEMQALVGDVSLSREKLADFVDDAGWGLKGRDPVAGPRLDPDPSVLFGGHEDEAEDEVEASRDFARRVFELLKERESLGVPLYPFRHSTDGIRLLGDIQGPYGFLLAVTLGHALSICENQEPEVLLERFVARALQRSGFSVANLGDYRRSGTFDERVLEGGKELHMQPDPEAAYRSRFANDEGVDVVANLWFGDVRPGRLLCLAQVTCCESEEWQAKFMQPRGSQWKKLLGVLADPVPLLAVPHHVPPRRFFALTQDSAGVLFDRLRLTRLRPDLTDDERELIACLEAQEVQPAELGTT